MKIPTMREAIEFTLEAIKKYPEHPMTASEVLLRQSLFFSSINDWQPIETAPKNGLEILLYSCGDIGVCYWRDDEIMTGWTWGRGKAFLNPSHWMFKPDAPQDNRSNV